jgi:CPA1 family monovalent cation:H+ antiporter
MKTCKHLDSLTANDFPEPRTPDACEECLAEGTRWVELRECLECGHVGCCDSSPRRHATKHFSKTKHPVVRSAMPGDTWTWCYIHEAMGEVSEEPAARPELAGDRT